MLFILLSHLFGFHNEEEKWNGKRWEDGGEKEVGKKKVNFI